MGIILPALGSFILALLRILHPLLTEEGYQVAKGAKAIRIKAPRIKKELNPTTQENEKVLIGYLGVSVFDVSQLTEDNRPPQFFPEV
ncbi:MAG: hypothetical protein M3Z24_11005, partial [Chloroflexota bacterium]|nr:hypothetical protein [Chloroflexota bacterium]